MFGAGRAASAGLEYRLTATSATGVSDNPGSRAEGTTTRFDGFETAQGRILLLHSGALAQSQATYGLTATTWLRGTQGFALSHVLGLSTAIAAGQAAQITLGTGATIAQLYMLDNPATPDPQAVGPRPAGSQQFLTVQAGQGLSLRLGSSWHLNQSLEGRLYRPLGDVAAPTSNKAAELGLEGAHQWPQSQLGLRSRVSMVQARFVGETGETTSLNSEFYELALGWRRDWTPEWSHDTAAGVVVMRAAERTRTLPALAAGVTWRSLGREIALRAAQSAGSSIYVGTTYERRSVSLLLALPANRSETLRLFTSADYEHASTAMASSLGEGSADIYSVRAGMYWQASEACTVGLEYIFRDQRASAGDSGASPFTSFRRQTGLLTVSIHYPSAVAR